MTNHSGTRLRAQSFDFFPHLNASQEAADSDETPAIAVNSPSSWSYLGPLLEPSSEHGDWLPASFHRWAGATLDGNLLAPLASFVLRANDFLRQEGLAHYWLTIRATQATPEYDCPRWHCDEYFFHEAERPDKGLNWWTNHLPPMLAGKRGGGQGGTGPSSQPPTDWKLCGVLAGPPTLFIPSNQQSKARQIRDRVRASCAKEHICASVRCVGCATAAEEVRKRLGEEYAGLGTVQAAKGQIACFRVGTARGAMHSEPRMDSDRIFVNVVPGTEDELRALSSRWGVEYPRSWSFRVVDQPRGYVGDLCPLPDSE